MNYLAHLLLSYPFPEEMVGNYMTDMLSWQEQQALTGICKRGMLIHRNIDQFTDQHEAVRASSKLLRETQGKYAPVVVDIVYDYLVARHWTDFCDLPLTAFIKEAYAILETFYAMMPDRIQSRTRRMIAGDWLHQYTKVEGLEFVFARLQSRTKYPNLLNEAVTVFLRDYGKHEVYFRQFFPEMMAQIPIWRAAIEDLREAG
ncbi:MAG: acyl carrier protein phosphodiesterase [Saprospiraceae bacterium]